MTPGRVATAVLCLVFLLPIAGCADGGAARAAAAKTARAKVCKEARDATASHLKKFEALSAVANAEGGDFYAKRDAGQQGNGEARLSAQVILDQPSCFTVETRANAREILAKFPTQ